ncbi:MAG: hypothetical protein Q7J80_09620, partial [Anaerolineales bacterium]|nr:hypothetical protein [Anaerolineales bacterium]
MSVTFDIDPYPGNPKILFIGLGSSSHTHAWIDLLAEAKMNIRLFSVPESDIPPKGWNIRSYICASSSRLTEGLDPNIRQCLYPLPEQIKRRESKLKKRISFWAFAIIKKVLNFVGRHLGLPGFIFDYTSYFQTPKVIAPEEWLAEIVSDWKPDVIHTLGLFDTQGGLFYYEARKRLELEKIGKWVLQLRGGSDIALRRFNPETAKQILEILSECDQVITDNYVNINYIKELGLGEKIAFIAPVPGTGGLDTDMEIED